mgnify:CR=1 FL=1
MADKSAKGQDMAKQIFEGIKVIDFTWAATGPQVSRELAEHGATVIRVESHKRLCPLRTYPPFRDGIPGVDRSAFFTKNNTNKYSISLDLTHPKSREVTRRLIQWTDIIGESMTPGSMARLGLDYESCSKINPKIVYFSTCQQGQYGPHRDFGGYGYHVNAVAGLSACTGWADGEPTMVFPAYSDFIAPWYVLIALAGALLRRRETGERMYIEQSQFEAGLTFVAPHILDFVVNGHKLTRNGNRDRYMCPHGIYPCIGQDRWVAITVADDYQWHQLCEMMGNPPWTFEQRFDGILNRKQNEEDLDQKIGEWTRDFTAEQVMTMLQEAGVPAGVVETAEDLFNDPQLKFRQQFRKLDHPVIGPHTCQAPAYTLSETPCEIARPAPCLGEHNEYIYRDILGFSDDEIADFIVEGVITTEADAPTKV